MVKYFRLEGNDLDAGRHLGYYHGFKCDHLKQHPEGYTTQVMELFSVESRPAGGGGMRIVHDRNHCTGCKGQGTNSG